MKNKVLVVDDEPAVRRLIRRILQTMNLEAIESEDGAGVVWLVKHQRPDLVLLDVHMPKLDGIATLTEILEIDPELPVVMVTGDLELDRVKLAMERGAAEYITKPFDVGTLEQAIKSNLERRIARQAAQPRRKENHGS